MGKIAAYSAYDMFCSEQPSQATANPVGGKACSSTKGGLLRYILNTYSNHKVSSLNFAYYKCNNYAADTLHQRIFQRDAIPSHYFPLREDSSRVLALGLHGEGNSGLAVVIIPLLSPNVTNSRAEPSHSKPRRWKSMPIHQGWFIALYTQHLLDLQSLELGICILQVLNMPLIRCTNVFFKGRLSRHSFHGISTRLLI